MAQKTVIGSYVNQNEALAGVRRLNKEGYSKEEITLYTNSELANTLVDSDYVDVEPRDAEEEATEDYSHGQQVQDNFTQVTYDYDKDSVESNSDQDEDILYPYRDAIADGYIIIVVDNYSINQHPEDDILTADDIDSDTVSTQSNINAGVPDRNINQDKMTQKNRENEVRSGYNREPLDYGVNADPSGRIFGSRGSDTNVTPFTNDVNQTPSAQNDKSTGSNQESANDSDKERKEKNQ